jgi:predicted nucleic acid-binding protein
MSKPSIVLDTNTFVAAGFNPDSDSAQIIREVESDHLRMVWNEETRGETEQVLRQIPHLSWETFAHLFHEEDRYEEETHPARFDYVPDPTDRKFAALSRATGATLITMDEDLLSHREHADVPILTPGEFLKS